MYNMCYINNIWLNTTTRRLSMSICWLFMSTCNLIIMNSNSFTCLRATYTDMVDTFKSDSFFFFFLSKSNTSRKWHFKMNKLHVVIWISCRSTEIGLIFVIYILEIIDYIWGVIKRACQHHYARCWYKCMKI